VIVKLAEVTAQRKHQRPLDVLKQIVAFEFLEFIVFNNFLTKSSAELNLCKGVKGII
jgi:hypothetical protein